MINISKLILPIITGFPILLSVIDNLLVYFKIENIFILNYIHTILLYLETPPKQQLHTLIFNNTLSLLTSIVFFIIYYLHDLKELNLKLKLKLLLGQILVIFGVFLLFPNLDSFVN